MSREERSGARDMTYSIWHREWTDLHIGRDGSDKLNLVDVDWIEFCRRCWWPLALMELAQDDGKDNVKTAIVTKRLAEMARVPSAVVFYVKTGAKGGIARFTVRTLTPTERADEVMAPAKYAAWLLAIHSAHLSLCQGSYSGRDQVRATFPERPT